MNISELYQSIEEYVSSMVEGIFIMIMNMVSHVLHPASALTKLYIGNISYHTTSEDLERYFGEIGAVSNVYLPVDRYSGEPRGFGFLAMSPEDAEKAIEAFDGTDMDGRTIEVKVSLPRGTKGPRRRSK